jgi:DNA-directed RNA polymerase subunit RPC12/RpoP
MVEMEDVPCKFCGSLIELSKAVQLNPESGEYEYACVNCAIKWEEKKERL